MNTKIQELARKEKMARDLLYVIEDKYSELEQEIKEDFHNQHPDYYISNWYRHSGFRVKRCSDNKVMDNFGCVCYDSSNECYYYRFDIKE